jgi:hypothetical protein
MDMQLYLRVRGRVLGPYDLDKLKLLVRRGQLSRMHEVSTDGANWVRASTYSELFVGAPVKLVAPEMQVASPPPAQLPRTLAESSDLSIPYADVVGQAPTSANPAAAAATGRSWRYEYLGSEQGPVDESVLREMLASGQLDCDALVWNESMPQWAAASQIPGLIPKQAVNRGMQGGGRSPGADNDMASLCKAAAASRPWALFLAITAFVYAILCTLCGFLLLANGANKGFPPLVAMGLFWVIGGVVNATGAILLLNYANRLGSLTYGASAKVLESAMNRLKVFWMFLGIVLIVTLAFLVFFTIWVFAIGVSLAHYM